ncbi:MAG TPA: hypothetical protein VHL80_15195 [Polyangia bacterium]|nr:hypothetical protein [Polyangia bacterium]
MPRAQPTALVVISLVVGVFGAPRARATVVVMELGVRAGYIFGRGWTVGPMVSALRGGVPSDSFERNELVLLGGLSASGDVVVSSSGQLSYRLHAGADVGLFHPCPSLAPRLTGGMMVDFHRGVSPRVGFEGGGSFLGGATNPLSSDRDVTSHPLLVGVGYRYARSLDGEHGHELGFETRMWFFPFETGAALGLCGSFAPDRPRPLG